MNAIDLMDNKTIKESEDGRTWTTALLESLGFAVIKTGRWAVCLNCVNNRGMKQSAIIGHIFAQHKVTVKMLGGTRESIRNKIDSLGLSESTPKFSPTSDQPQLPLLPVLEGEVCDKQDCRKVFAKGTSIESKKKHASGHLTFKTCYYQSLQHNGPFIEVPQPVEKPDPASEPSTFDRLMRDSLEKLLAKPTPMEATQANIRNLPPHVVHSGFARFLGDNGSMEGRQRVVDMCSLPRKTDPEWGWLLPASLTLLESVETKASGMPYHLLSVFDGLPMYVYVSYLFPS